MNTHAKSRIPAILSATLCLAFLVACTWTSGADTPTPARDVQKEFTALPVASDDRATTPAAQPTGTASPTGKLTSTPISESTESPAADLVSQEQALGEGESADATGTGASGAGGAAAGPGECRAETCCARTVAALPFAMPEGQLDDEATYLAIAVESQHMDARDSDCPLGVDFVHLEGLRQLEEIIDKIGEIEGAPPDPEAVAAKQRLLDIDYLFEGSVTVVEQTGFTERTWDEGTGGYIGGDILGTFSIHVQLWDNHHDEIVKQGTISCAGHQFGLSECYDDVKALSRTFKPLDNLICDYERLPANASVEPEEEEVAIGEETTVRLQGVVDGWNRVPHQWWWLFVKVEHGEILNAEHEKDEFYLFRVGDGAVEIQYKAPDDCPAYNTETVSVFNTCNKEEHFIGVPEDEIASGEFEIICPLELEVHFLMPNCIEPDTEMGRIKLKTVDYEGPKAATDPDLEGEGHLAIYDDDCYEGYFTISIETDATVKGWYGGTEHDPVLHVEFTIGEGFFDWHLSEPVVNEDEIRYFNVALSSPTEAGTVIPSEFPLVDGATVDHLEKGIGWRFVLHLDE